MVTCHFKKNPPENLLLKAGGFGVVGEKKGGGGDGLVRKNGGEHDRCRRLGWSRANVGEGGKMEPEMERDGNGERDMVRWV